MNGSNELVPQGLEQRIIAELKMLQENPTAAAALAFVKAQDFRLSDLMRFQGILNRVTAVTLYAMRRAWESLGEEGAWRLWEENPWCVRDEFRYSFEHYAQMRTGYKWTTLNNMIRTARLWYVKDSPVEIPERVEAVDPKTGELTGEVVELDPWEISPSKLLSCSTRFERGEMTEEDWGILANPESTFRDVWKNVRGKEDDGPRGFYLYMEGELLMAAEKGFDPQCVGQLYWDSEEELVQKALRRLVDRADIVVRG